VADFEAFRQLAEQGGTFFGQNTGQPMAHEHQNEFASTRGFEPPLQRGVMGKHGFGAVGELVRQSLAQGRQMDKFLYREEIDGFCQSDWMIWNSGDRPPAK
jgi:hypothetical protein